MLRISLVLPFHVFFECCSASHSARSGILKVAVLRISLVLPFCIFVECYSASHSVRCGFVNVAVARTTLAFVFVCFANVAVVRIMCAVDLSMLLWLVLRSPVFFCVLQMMLWFAFCALWRKCFSPNTITCVVPETH